MGFFFVEKKIVFTSIVKDTIVWIEQGTSWKCTADFNGKFVPETFKIAVHELPGTSWKCTGKFTLILVLNLFFMRSEIR